MIFQIVLSVFLLQEPDSLVYINAQNQTVFAQNLTWNPVFKENLKPIKQKTKIERGLIGRKTSQKWTFFNIEGTIIADSIEAFFPIDERKISFKKNNLWCIYPNIESQKLIFAYSEIKKSDNLYLGKESNKIEIFNAKIAKTYNGNYDALAMADSNHLIFSQSGKQGLFRKSDKKIILEPLFDQIQMVSDSVFIVFKNQKFGVFNHLSQNIIPIEYDRIKPDTMGMLKVFIRKVSTMGDIKNIKVIDEKSGIYSPKGEKLLPCMYDDIGAFTEGLFPVKKETDWGFVNSHNEEIIRPFYRKYTSFVAKQAAVSKGFYWGIIDPKGSWIILPEYSDIQPVNESVWIWKKREKSGFYFPKTKSIGTETYDEIKPTEGGFFRILQNGNFGLLSADLKPIIKPEYTSLKVYPNEKIIMAGKINYYSIFFLNGNLKVFMNYPFTQMTSYINGMAMVTQNERVGFIDADGQLLVSTQYDEARPFSDGVAAIRLNEKWGFVNKTENMIASPNYTEILDFEGSVTAGKRDGQWKIILKNGKEAHGLTYDQVSRNEFGNLVVKSKNKYGIVDTKGNEIINPVYRDCVELAKGIFKIRAYNKYGLVDSKNQFLTTIQYDDIQYSQSGNCYIFITKGEWKVLK
jgi:hypothetical protein